MQKGHRIGGRHTTCNDLATTVIDVVRKVPGVKNVIPGAIDCHHAAGGSRRVKIGDMTGGILLIARQSRSVQELQVFCCQTGDVKLGIARALRDNDIPISFRKTNSAAS